MPVDLFDLSLIAIKISFHKIVGYGLISLIFFLANLSNQLVHYIFFVGLPFYSQKLKFGFGIGDWFYGMEKGFFEFA